MEGTFYTFPPEKNFPWHSLNEEDKTRLIDRMNCLEDEGLIDITMGGIYGSFARILQELYQLLKEVLGQHVPAEGPEWWTWEQVLRRC